MLRLTKLVGMCILTTAVLLGAPHQSWADDTPAEIEVAQVPPVTESGRVQALLIIGQKYGATQDDLVRAIAGGMSAEQFALQLTDSLNIAGATKAALGSPVQLTAQGLPEDKPYAEQWIRSPVADDDTFLLLFDRAGNPVNIFWSGTPGRRTFQLIIAVNGGLSDSGAELPPVLDVAHHTLQYGEDAPPPPPPGPTPTPLPVPSRPNAELRGIVQPIDAMLAGDPQNGIDMAGFWLAIADAIQRDDQIKMTVDIRNTLHVAEENAYAQTAFVGKYPGFSKIVNEGYDDYVGLDNVTLDSSTRRKSAEFFRAVAWACYPKPE